MTTTTKELQGEKYALQSKLQGSYTYGEKSAFRRRIKEINAELRASAATAQALSPIPAAIAPMKDAAMDYAEEQAREYYQRLVKIMAKHDWNLDAAAPYPSATKHDKRTYRSMLATRQALGAPFARDRERSEAFWRSEFEAGRHISGGSGAVNFYKQDDERLAHFIRGEREAAALSFDAYVAKLSHKVGACDAASVTGRLWQGSTLTVTKGETVERWHTQQIVNYSVLGKAFNQWPTRLMK